MAVIKELKKKKKKLEGLALKDPDSALVKITGKPMKSIWQLHPTHLLVFWHQHLLTTAIHSPHQGQ